ncbi:hypothetical protein ACJMK2_028244 [Sinanodonta woodiana]|uniref:Uncharacterized protein n=1 Tax=Sinanodonta woodiana TaxID=1069815 RepID=A0ABD3X6H2_SINWO
MNGSRSRLHLYFDVVIERNTLLAYHGKGCQLISFAEDGKAPRLAEILAALQAMGTNMSIIQGLQNAGRNRYMLYPIDMTTPILNVGVLDVQGHKAYVTEAPSFEREIGPRTTDVHITGLSLQIDMIELQNKLPTFQLEANIS